MTALLLSPGPQQAGCLAFFSIVVVTKILSALLIPVFSPCPLLPSDGPKDGTWGPVGAEKALALPMATA